METLPHAIKANNGAGRVKHGGDSRAVNTAVTGPRDIWAAKWLGAAVTSRTTATSQKR